MEYVYYLLSVIGIGYFITGSDLAEPFREWIKEVQVKGKILLWIVEKLYGVISCIYCCSFWLGLGVYGLGYLDNQIIDLVLSAFSVMGLIWIVKNINK